MTYLVTTTYQDADRINKLFLRVWAQGLVDDGYKVNGDGDPATGVKGGKHVHAVTTNWYVPKETLGGKWAVLVPEEKDSPKFKEVVKRSFSQIDEIAGVSLDFDAFKGALGLPVDLLTTDKLDLTIEQWGTAALISSGIQYELLSDVDVRWPDDV